jgi:metal-responsive CopG/Arc/MetJ family transcriptional regulator
MTETKKQRKGRTPIGEKAKKIVSLTIDSELLEKIDSYAADKKLSRSAAIEEVIIKTLSTPTTSRQTTDRLAAMRETENNLVQSSDGAMFAAPQLGRAVLY